MSPNEDQDKQIIDDAKDLVIDSIAETMDLYGVTRSTGTLYGTMYFEEDMTLDQMRTKLEMSKPSMSTGVKKLQDYEIVKKSFKRGSRKNIYQAEKDFFRFFNKFFTHKWEREVKLNLEAIADAQKMLDEVLHSESSSHEAREEALKVYRQLENSKPYYYWLESLVASIRSGRIFESVPVENKKE
ncbi:MULTISPECIES: choline uptake/conversion transcriptional regulator CudC [Alteribacter]|uniref:HTH-type transcriptional regulator n=1 Tax=Alteribacter keqinensis TaxID=2483800 RepID=A0A3M7TS17_9BACI|nr:MULTISPECIES: GbsR/MarR family transcriptional regulator [Alteribacter]MBM7095348.1 GbsR/MarR family transcriptional regulator [Alteribacter salitolerans]RNA67090.1 GbsR/MarR family transcriptional regulator [Alteribacter keqinensis]